MEPQSWQFSDPVSCKSQCKALWRICPAPWLLPPSADPGGISRLSRIPWQPEKQTVFLIMQIVMCTLTQKNRENGIRARQRSKDTRASRRAQQPGPSGSPGSSSCTPHVTATQLQYLTGQMWLSSESSSCRTDHFSPPSGLPGATNYWLKKCQH